MNLGGIVSPRVKQQKASNSPVPATIPQQSPNTNNTNTQSNQQQANLVGIPSTHTAQQPQESNILHIPSTVATAQIMKEHHQQPMVLTYCFFKYLMKYIRNLFFS